MASSRAASASRPACLNAGLNHHLVRRRPCEARHAVRAAVDASATRQVHSAPRRGAPVPVPVPVPVVVTGEAGMMLVAKPACAGGAGVGSASSWV